MEVSTLFPDQELIHSLHQWIDLCREAFAKGDPCGRSLTRVLNILRQLLNAPVAVMKVDWVLETCIGVSTGDPTSENWLANDRHFLRICERLFEAPQPLLVGDALEGKEFADPRLRSQFPRLSILTTGWSLPCGEIIFAFFSHVPGHFRPDQTVLLDYFGSRRLGTPWCVGHERDELCVAERG